MDFLITKEIVEYYSESRKSDTHKWFIRNFLPEPPFFTSQIKLDLEKYSSSTQKRIINSLNGFISVATQFLYIENITKRIDFGKPVSQSEVRLAILLSLKLYDGITPPVDVSFSSLRYEIKEGNSIIPFSRRRFLVYKNKTLSFRTTQLINYFAIITNKKSDRIIKRQYNKLGITEQERLRKIRQEIIEDILSRKERGY